MDAAWITHELINAAARDGIPICEQAWSGEALACMAKTSDLYFGWDFARSGDLSVIWALGKQGSTLRTVAVLRMKGLRTPAQNAELDRLCCLRTWRKGAIDFTGPVVGATDVAQENWGINRIEAVNFQLRPDQPPHGRRRAQGPDGTRPGGHGLFAAGSLRGPAHRDPRGVRHPR
jgi:phage FluMu gp28-like protein